MAAEAAGHGSDLVQVVSLLAAGVVAVPVFKRLDREHALELIAAGTTP